jgi:hypothetical protein
MIVHDIEMDDVRACGENVIDLFTESGKVSCQNRWCYLIIGHDNSWLQVAGNLHQIGVDFSLVKMDNNVHP